MTRVQVILALCGAGVMAWLVKQVGWEALSAAVRLVGPGGFATLFVFFALAQLPSCIGWRWVMGASGERVTLWDLYPLYAVGDALNATIASADTAGEVTKVMMLRNRMPWERAVASVTVHRILEVIALSLLLTLGLIVSWARLDLPPWWYAVGLIVLGGMFAVVWGFFHLQTTGLYGPLFRRLVSHFGGSAQWGEGIDVEMRSALSDRRTILLATAMVLVSWSAGVVEAYLCLRWLQLPARWDLALAVESFGLFVMNLGYFVPGRLGVSEGGRALLFAALGLPLSAAIGFALVRRLREFAWIGFGLGVLLVHRTCERRVSS